MDFSNSRAAAVFDQIALLNLPENVHTNVSCINLLGPKSSTKPPSSSLSTATTTTSSIREAYLLPLLERHNAGKAIYYEDLESSYQKAKDALCKLETSQKSSHNEVMTKLHQSQLEAYKKTAIQNLKVYAGEFKAPPIPKSEGDDNEEEYIKKCVEQALDACAGWKVEKSIFDQFITSDVTQKAKGYYIEQSTPRGKEAKLVPKNPIKESIAVSTLPAIQETEKEEDEENSNEDTLSDDANNDEITSEEDGEDEEENRKEKNEVSKASLGDNNSDPSNAAIPSNKNEDVNGSQSSTKISLLKVTKRKRPIMPSSLGQLNNTKSRKISLNAGNGSQAKRNRGGRRSGRGRRRGGKN